MEGDQGSQEPHSLAILSSALARDGAGNQEFDELRVWMSRALDADGGEPDEAARSFLDHWFRTCVGSLVNNPRFLRNPVPPHYVTILFDVVEFASLVVASSPMVVDALEMILCIPMNPEQEPLVGEVAKQRRRFRSEAVPGDQLDMAALALRAMGLPQPGSVLPQVDVHAMATFVVPLAARFPFLAVRRRRPRLLASGAPAMCSMVDVHPEIDESLHIPLPGISWPASGAIRVEEAMVVATPADVAAFGVRSALVNSVNHCHAVFALARMMCDASMPLIHFSLAVKTVERVIRVLAEDSDEVCRAYVANTSGLLLGLIAHRLLSLTPADTQALHQHLCGQLITSIDWLLSFSGGVTGVATPAMRAFAASLTLHVAIALLHSTSLPRRVEGLNLLKKHVDAVVDGREEWERASLVKSRLPAEHLPAAHRRLDAGAGLQVQQELRRLCDQEQARAATEAAGTAHAANGNGGTASAAAAPGKGSEASAAQSTAEQGSAEQGSAAQSTAEQGAAEQRGAEQGSSVEQDSVEDEGSVSEASLAAVPLLPCLLQSGAWTTRSRLLRWLVHQGVVGAMLAGNPPEREVLDRCGDLLRAIAGVETGQGEHRDHGWLQTLARLMVDETAHGTVRDSAARILVEVMPELGHVDLAVIDAAVGSCEPASLRAPALHVLKIAVRKVGEVPDPAGVGFISRTLQLLWRLAAGQPDDGAGAQWSTVAANELQTAMRGGAAPMRAALVADSLAQLRAGIQPHLSLRLIRAYIAACPPETASDEVMRLDREHGLVVALLGEGAAGPQGASGRGDGHGDGDESSDGEALTRLRGGIDPSSVYLREDMVTTIGDEEDLCALEAARQGTDAAPAVTFAAPGPGSEAAAASGQPASGHVPPEEWVERLATLRDLFAASPLTLNAAQLDSLWRRLVGAGGAQAPAATALFDWLTDMNADPRLIDETACEDLFLKRIPALNPRHMTASGFRLFRCHLLWANHRSGRLRVAAKASALQPAPQAHRTELPVAGSQPAQLRTAATWPTQQQKPAVGSGSRTRPIIDMTLPGAVLPPSALGMGEEEEEEEEGAQPPFNATSLGELTVTLLDPDLVGWRQMWEVTLEAAEANVATAGTALIGCLYRATVAAAMGAGRQGGGGGGGGGAAGGRNLPSPSVTAASVPRDRYGTSAQAQALAQVVWGPRAASGADTAGTGVAAPQACAKYVHECAARLQLATSFLWGSIRAASSRASTALARIGAQAPHAPRHMRERALSAASEPGASTHPHAPGEGGDDGTGRASGRSTPTTPGAGPGRGMSGEDGSTEAGSAVVSAGAAASSEPREWPGSPAPAPAFRLGVDGEADIYDAVASRVGGGGSSGEETPSPPLRGVAAGTGEDAAGKAMLQSLPPAARPYRGHNPATHCEETPEWRNRVFRVLIILRSLVKVAREAGPSFLTAADRTLLAGVSDSEVGGTSSVGDGDGSGVHRPFGYHRALRHAQCGEPLISVKARAQGTGAESAVYLPASAQVRSLRAAVAKRLAETQQSGGVLGSVRLIANGVELKDDDQTLTAARIREGHVVLALPCLAGTATATGVFGSVAGTSAFRATTQAGMEEEEEEEEADGSSGGGTQSDDEALKQALAASLEPQEPTAPAPDTAKASDAMPAQGSSGEKAPPAAVVVGAAGLLEPGSGAHRDRWDSVRQARDPVALLSSHHYFNLLFTMLSADQSVAFAAWSLLQELPTSDLLLAAMLDLGSSTGSTRLAVPWRRLLDASSPFKLRYALQLVASLLDNDSTLPEGRAKWRDLALSRGLLPHVADVLATEDLLAPSRGVMGMPCLTSLLTTLDKLLAAEPATVAPTTATDGDGDGGGGCALTLKAALRLQDRLVHVVHALARGAASRPGILDPALRRAATKRYRSSSGVLPPAFRAVSREQEARIEAATVSATSAWRSLLAVPFPVPEANKGTAGGLRPLLFAFLTYPRMGEWLDKTLLAPDVPCVSSAVSSLLHWLVTADRGGDGGADSGSGGSGVETSPLGRKRDRPVGQEPTGTAADGEGAADEKAGEGGKGSAAKRRRTPAGSAPGASSASAASAVATHTVLRKEAVTARSVLLTYALSLLSRAGTPPRPERGHAFFELCRGLLSHALRARTGPVTLADLPEEVFAGGGGEGGGAAGGGEADGDLGERARAAMRALVHGVCETRGRDQPALQVAMPHIPGLETRWLALLRTDAAELAPLLVTRLTQHVAAQARRPQRTPAHDRPDAAVLGLLRLLHVALNACSRGAAVRLAMQTPVAAPALSVRVLAMSGRGEEAEAEARRAEPSWRVRGLLPFLALECLYLTPAAGRGGPEAVRPPLCQCAETRQAASDLLLWLAHQHPPCLHALTALLAALHVHARENPLAVYATAGSVAAGAIAVALRGPAPLAEPHAPSAGVQGWSRSPAMLLPSHLVVAGDGAEAALTDAAARLLHDPCPPSHGLLELADAVPLAAFIGHTVAAIGAASTEAGGAASGGARTEEEGEGELRRAVNLLESPAVTSRGVRVLTGVSHLQDARRPSLFGFAAVEGLTTAEAQARTLASQLLQARAGQGEMLPQRDFMGVTWRFVPNKLLRPPDGYVGLRNLGCTCYMNSLLQQLFMVPALRYGLLQAEGASGEHVRVLEETRKLFAALHASERAWVDPRPLVEATPSVSGGQINVREQQDAMEFFSLFADKLESAMAKTPQRRLMSRLFGGKLCNQILVRECGHVSEVEEPFLMLSVEVKNHTSLQSSLQSYVVGEHLTGGNQYLCSQCNQRRDAVKRACVGTLPEVLFVHLKRFTFDLDTMARLKVHDSFQFPFTLDMRPYTRQGVAAAGDERSSPSAAKQGAGEEGDEVGDEEEETYDLQGILLHRGGAMSGHYYSFVLERAAPGAEGEGGARWFEFNDTEVQEWSPARVAEDAFGGVDPETLHTRTGSAYILVYERRGAMKRMVDWHAAEAGRRGGMEEEEEEEEGGEAAAGVPAEAQHASGAGKKAAAAAEEEEKEDEEEVAEAPFPDPLLGNRVIVTMPRLFAPVLTENEDVLRDAALADDAHPAMLLHLVRHAVGALDDAAEEGIEPWSAAAEAREDRREPRLWKPASGGAGGAGWTSSMLPVLGGGGAAGLAAVQAATRWLFELGFRAKNANPWRELQEELEQVFSRSRHAALWLVAYLARDSTWLTRAVVEAPPREVRRAAGRLVVLAARTVALWESAAGDDNEREARARPTAALLVAWCAQFPALRENWALMEEGCLVIRGLLEASPTVRRLALRLGVPTRLLDFAFAERSIFVQQRLTQQSGKSEETRRLVLERLPMRSQTHVADQRHMFAAVAVAVQELGAVDLPAPDPTQRTLHTPEPATLALLCGGDFAQFLAHALIAQSQASSPQDVATAAAGIVDLTGEAPLAGFTGPSPQEEQSGGDVPLLDGQPGVGAVLLQLPQSLARGRPVARARLISNLVSAVGSVGIASADTLLGVIADLLDGVDDPATMQHLCTSMPTQLLQSPPTMLAFGRAMVRRRATGPGEEAVRSLARRMWVATAFWGVLASDPAHWLVHAHDTERHLAASLVVEVAAAAEEARGLLATEAGRAGAGVTVAAAHACLLTIIGQGSAARDVGAGAAGEEEKERKEEEEEEEEEEEGGAVLGILSALVMLLEEEAGGCRAGSYRTYGAQLTVYDAVSFPLLRALQAVHGLLASSLTARSVARAGSHSTPCLERVRDRCGQLLLRAQQPPHEPGAIGAQTYDREVAVNLLILDALARHGVELPASLGDAVASVAATRFDEAAVRRESAACTLAWHCVWLRIRAAVTLGSSSSETDGRPALDAATLLAEARSGQLPRDCIVARPARAVADVVAAASVDEQPMRNGSFVMKEYGWLATDEPRPLHSPRMQPSGSVPAFPETEWEVLTRALTAMAWHPRLAYTALLQLPHWLRRQGVYGAAAERQCAVVVHVAAAAVMHPSSGPRFQKDRGVSVDPGGHALLPDALWTRGRAGSVLGACWRVLRSWSSQEAAAVGEAASPAAWERDLALPARAAVLARTLARDLLSRRGRAPATDAAAVLDLLADAATIALDRGTELGGGGSTDLLRDLGQAAAATVEALPSPYALASLQSSTASGRAAAVDRLVREELLPALHALSALSGEVAAAVAEAVAAAHWHAASAAEAGLESCCSSGPGAAPVSGAASAATAAPTADAVDAAAGDMERDGGEEGELPDAKRRRVPARSNAAGAAEEEEEEEEEEEAEGQEEEEEEAEGQEEEEEEAEGQEEEKEEVEGEEERCMIPAAAAAMNSSWWTASEQWSGLVGTLAASMAAGGATRHASECSSLLLSATWLGIARGAASSRPATASLARRLGLRWLHLPLPSAAATATEEEARAALHGEAAAWGGAEGRAATPGGEPDAAGLDAGTRWSAELRGAIARELSPAGQSLVATIVSAASAPTRLARMLQALGAFVGSGGSGAAQALAPGQDSGSALMQAYSGRRMDAACAHPGPALADIVHILTPVEAFPSGALVDAARAACALVTEGWRAGADAKWASLAGGAVWLVHLLRMVLWVRGEGASVAQEEKDLVESVQRAAQEARSQIGAEAAAALGAACEHTALRTQWVWARWSTVSRAVEG